MANEKINRVDTEIPDGDAGIDATVVAMWRLANRDAVNPEIVAIARKYKTADATQTTRALFDYVWKNYPYKSDPAGREQITAPIHMVNGNNPQEDCDGLVTLLVSLLTAAGINSRIKVIAWRRHEYTHVIAEFYDGSQWWPLDPTKKADGWKNQVQKVIREKRYENPNMIMTTLEDNASCGCGKKKSRRPVNENDNKIEINIGNTNKADTYAPSSTEFMKGVTATETGATNTFPSIAAQPSNGAAGALNAGMAPIMPPVMPPQTDNGITTNSIAPNIPATNVKRVIKQKYPAWQ